MLSREIVAPIFLVLLAVTIVLAVAQSFRGVSPVRRFASWYAACFCALGSVAMDGPIARDVGVDLGSLLPALAVISIPGAVIALLGDQIGREAWKRRA